MRYRDIIAGEFLNIEPFSKFIRKVIIKSVVVMIEFTDDDLDEIRELYKSSATDIRKRLSTNISERTVVGSDNHTYILNDGGITKQSDTLSFSLKKALRLNRRHYIKRSKQNEYTAKRIADYDRTQSVSLPSISSFKAYEYVDKETGICFHYRLRACKEKQQPVVIYFHGGGALGYDNTKQLAEFRMIGGGLSKQKATILLPQAPYGSNRFTDAYLLSVKKLTDTIADEASADKSRVSIFGTSFGGGCAWQMIWDYPEYFACAVPVMGALPASWESQSGANIDMSRLKDVPLWVAHSADDKEVKIKNDDLCVQKLRELGANVKYTRWEKYGHTMSSKFYRREKWVDFMLSQSLDNRLIIYCSSNRK